MRVRHQIKPVSVSCNIAMLRGEGWVSIACCPAALLRNEELPCSSHLMLGWKHVGSANQGEQKDLANTEQANRTRSYGRCSGELRADNEGEYLKDKRTN
jgi:hypothetical protein